MSKDMYSIPNSTVGNKVTECAPRPNSNVPGSLASKTDVERNAHTFQDAPSRKIPIPSQPMSPPPKKSIPTPPGGHSPPPKPGIPVKGDGAMRPGNFGKRKWTY